jgi:hypothetical protein
MEDKQIGIPDIYKALFRVCKADERFIAEEDTLMIFHCLEGMQEFYPAKQCTSRVVRIADKLYIGLLWTGGPLCTGKSGREFILAESRGLDKIFTGSCAMAERDRTEYPDDLYGSVAYTDISGIPAKNFPYPFFKSAVGIIRIP